MRGDLDHFIACKRTFRETERCCFTYQQLSARDQLNLDSLPSPGLIAAEIVDSLATAALDHFRTITNSAPRIAALGARSKLLCYHAHNLRH